MKRAKPNNSINEHITDGIIASWLVGFATVGLAEWAVTGGNILDNGGSWQSWVAGGLAGLVSFAVVVAWRRRQAPPNE